MARSENIKFQNLDGDELKGSIDFPDEDPKAFAIFAHCFTCSKTFNATSRISKGLTRNGFAVLRFDFTGLGNSAGYFSNTDFRTNIDDILQGVKYLTENYETPKLMVGHSLGGTAILGAAAQVEGAKAVATIGSPFDPGHVVHHFDEALDEINSKGEAEVMISGRPFKVKKRFLDAFEGLDVKSIIAGLKKALIVFHSPLDQTVSIDNAGEIFMAAKHPKSFVSLDTADHLLTNPKDTEFVASVLSRWAARYIDEASDKATRAA